jgi:hypothetical protein
LAQPSPSPDLLTFFLGWLDFLSPVCTEEIFYPLLVCVCVCVFEYQGLISHELVSCTHSPPANSPVLVGSHTAPPLVAQRMCVCLCQRRYAIEESGGIKLWGWKGDSGSMSGSGVSQDNTMELVGDRTSTS